MLTDLFFFFSRDNATDAQVCSGLGTCLCGDCVCKKTGVSVMSQYKKDRGACWKIWKKTVRGTRTLFCGRGFKYLSPEWYQFVNVTVHTVVCFWLNTPTGFVKARTEHLRGIKTALLTSKRYNEEITIFVLWSGRFCPCTCKILLIIAKVWLRCLPFPYKSGNVHVKYTFLFTAVIFFSFALVKLSTANTVNAATLIVLQTQTRTSYVAVRITVIFQPKQEKMKRSPT